MKLLARIIVIIGFSVALVACGGGNGPSEDALTTFAKSDEGFDYLLKDGQRVDSAGDGTSNDGISKKTARCVAKIFRDSDVSDATLTSYVNGEDLSSIPVDDRNAIDSLRSKFENDCKES